VSGTVADDPGTLALYTSDASIYRQVPLAVVVPRTVDDVVAAVAACADTGAPLVPRGGGTSLAGNSIGGVVIDTSRHLNEIVDIDVDNRLATVQPGVVLTDLTKATAPYGLTFGPDPSSAGRCTLGGMIGNNSCGSRSVAWGTTADNVERLDVLCYDGTRLDLGAVSAAELDRLVAQPGRRAEIHRGLRDLAGRHELLIRRRFGGLSRQVSGYSLNRLLPEHGPQPAQALVGSEGTCATTLGATVRLVPLPKARALLVLGFPSTFAAADAVPVILPHRPLTVEGINDQLVAALPASARGGPGVAALSAGAAWLMVEVTGDSVAEAADAGEAISRDVLAADGTATSVLVSDPSAQAELWRVRTDGAGLATRMPDGSEAWSGFEDAAVPPDRLGAYLRDFHALQERYGLGGLVYGHYGEGCLHVRIDFDLFSTAGVVAYRRFVEEGTDLVVGYGGSVSGEHGDGRARSELLTRMYGADLVGVFGEFKAIWDPGDRMNPGVLVRPQPLDTGLRNGPDVVPKDPPTVFGFHADGNSLARATRRCVGIGKCRQTGGGVMCPSYQVTRDEKHSTRGRAHLLWEMLRGEVITDGWRSAEVRDALDLCLSCKGCKADCPVNVDMATYKSEFLYHHYRRRLRPVSHYSMGWLPLWARLASAAPGVVNAVTRLGPVKRLGGIAPQRDVPRFARSLRRSLRGRAPANPDGPRVLLWPDTFTTYLQPETGLAAVDVLESAGFQVVLPRRSVCCGLTWISTGQLGVARRVLRRTMAALSEELEAGTTIVGLEPSCTAVLRDDAADLLSGHAAELARRAAERTRTLAELLSATDWQPPEIGREALVQTHCHQHAVMGFSADREVLAAAGVTATVPDSGCCGLAGNFGFERDHYGVSVAAAERVLLPAVREASEDTLIVADGFSCRTQIRQQTGREPLHLAQVLRLGITAAGRARAHG
jgi:FAD/FMN-containing dehydrogenase/Fe-S oxidoreductase